MKKAVLSSSATGTAATTPHLNNGAGGGGGGGGAVSSSSSLFLSSTTMSSSGGGGGNSNANASSTSTSDLLTPGAAAANYNVVLTATSPMTSALPSVASFLFGGGGGGGGGTAGQLKELIHPIHSDALKQHSSLTMKLLKTGKYSHFSISGVGRGGRWRRVIYRPSVHPLERCLSVCLMNEQNNLAGRKDSLFSSGCREEKRHETGRAGQNFNGGHVGLSIGGLC